MLKPKSSENYKIGRIIWLFFMLYGNLIFLWKLQLFNFALHMQKKALNKFKNVFKYSIYQIVIFQMKLKISKLIKIPIKWCYKNCFEKYVYWCFKIFKGFEWKKTRQTLWEFPGMFRNVWMKTYVWLKLIEINWAKLNGL